MDVGMLAGRKWGVATVASGILLGLFCIISWLNGYESIVNPFVGLTLFVGSLACYLKNRYTLWIFGLAILLNFFVAIGDYNRTLPENREGPGSILTHTLIVSPPLLFAYIDRRRAVPLTT